MALSLESKDTGRRKRETGEESHEKMAFYLIRFVSDLIGPRLLSCFALNWK